MRRKVIYVRKDILIHDLSNLPSFHKSGSIRGIKKLQLWEIYHKERLTARY